MATKRAPVSDSDIRAIVRAEIASADGRSNSQLSVERAENMDRYQGAPYGNEVDGRSSVVFSTVRDVIEWMLPSIMRIFTSGEDAVEFQPEEPKDLQAAKQATDYVNFIWNRDNHGYLNFYSWFKDALLQKNGVIKIWWDDTPRTKRERYSGLDDAGFADLVNDPNVEVSEHTEKPQEVEFIGPDGKPQKQSITTHDLVITRQIPGGRVKVVPVPPEEFLISKDARNIEDARFVGHRRRRTISELAEEGFDREVCERLSGDETSIQTDSEEIKRNTVEYVVPMSESTVNPAMRQIWVTEGYIRVDVDGDGIAEMRKVVVAGSAYEILSNEAWDTPRPFASLTPIIMPHRYHGLAVADLIKDLQLIQTTIWRQYLDSLYLANNPREEVVESRIIDPQEVLSQAPGRKIRVKPGNGPAISPVPTVNVGAQALEGLNYADQISEKRTGVSQRTQGLAANQLHDTAAGERMLMSAAMGKIELIARTFAETGVRDAFRLILKLIVMYQDKPRMIRLRNEFVPMDPSQWNSDMDLVVQVGMGMGDKDQQLMHATMLAQLQEKAYQLGFVTPENFKNLAEIAVNAMGFKGVDRFFTFPQPGQPQANHGAQDPKAQAEMVKAQGQMKIEQQKAQGQMQLAQQKHQLEAQASVQQAGVDMQLEKYRIDTEAQLKRYQIDQELQLKSQQLAAELQLKQTAQSSVHVGGEPG